MNDEILKERIINGLYGQAVADAVGDPFEFKTRIDPKSVSRYAKKAARLNITDDTQMALFGFEAVERMSRMNGDFGRIASQSFTQSYIDWFLTQDEVPHRYKGHSGLLGFPELHVQRAPGNTCLQSCLNLKRGVNVVNDSKGCGSVMRLLPSMMFEDYGECLSSALISAHLTHHHKENRQAAYDYIVAARICLGHGSFGDEMSTNISDLGEGWTAQECVNMAIFAFQKARDFDELLEISIAHDGDSDSVGAVAGSLWGLAGREVPQEYIDKLVEHDALKYVVEHYIKSQP